LGAAKESQVLITNRKPATVGDSAEFWLNVQRRSDLWEAMNSATDKARVERARPLSGAA
jgi:plasmid maintenance system antidote protein VapI